MKRKLLYITSDAWWDTDVTIIPQLVETFEVNAYVASMAKIKENKYPQKNEIKGAHIHNCCFVRSQYNPIMLISSFLYFIKLVFSSIKADYVFWVVDSMVYYSIPFAFCCNKNKTIISYHNYEVHPGTSSFTGLQQKLFLRLFTLFHFHSVKQEALFKKDFPQKKSFSTLMPVKFLGLPSKTNKLFDNHKRTFLFLGMIRNYKRPDLFINAAYVNRDKANFILAGKADDYNELLKLTSNSKIYLKLDFLSNDDMAYFMSQTDFLVLPYDHTTQSGPLLIAYAYNKPVIATRLDYFSEMVKDKETGFLFNPGSQSELNDIISYCSNMPSSEYEKMERAVKIQTMDYNVQSDFSSALTTFLNSEVLR